MFENYVLFHVSYVQVSRRLLLSQSKNPQQWFCARRTGLERKMSVFDGESNSLKHQTAQNSSKERNAHTDVHKRLKQYCFLEPFCGTDSIFR